jgi:oligogalacturonide lyase
MKKFPLLLLACAGLVPTVRAADLPRAWIDPDTGHRIVQLSTEPGSASLYFTQYAYTAGGAKLLMTTSHGIDLVTLATGRIEHVYEGADARVLQTGRKTGAIFYSRGGFLYALDPATRQSRQVARAPEHGTFITVNADETLAAGSITAGGERPRRPLQPPGGYQPGQGVQKGG